MLAPVMPRLLTCAPHEQVGNHPNAYFAASVAYHKDKSGSTAGAGGAGAGSATAGTPASPATGASSAAFTSPSTGVKRSEAPASTEVDAAASPSLAKKQKSSEDAPAGSPGPEEDVAMTA
mgnify:CR=1 FL=1